MQTKTFFSRAALVASASAAAVSVSDSAMPTLGGSPWYDWSSSAPGETSTESWAAAWTPSASVSSSVVATATSEWASVWTASSSAASSSWGAVWTPSASSASSSSWGTVWTPSASSSSPSWGAAEWTSAPVAETSLSSSVPYENPFTSYTTMTNSWGVITGMPAVVTSQPTQAIPAGWTTTTIPLPKFANTTATTAVGPTATGFQQSSSPSIAIHTGAAVSSNRVSGAGFGLMVVGLVFGMF